MSGEERKPERPYDWRKDLKKQEQKNNKIPTEKNPNKSLGDLFGDLFRDK